MAWAPALAWAAAIFWASSRSTLPEAAGLPGVDKAAHFAAYAVLGALLSHGTSRTGLTPRLAVGLGLLYGVTDEVHQRFVPGRSPDPLDWLADACGVLAGIIIHTRWRVSRARRGAASARRAHLPST